MGTSVEVGEIEEWTTAKVRFPGFADLQTGAGSYEESPVFTCCGNQWSVGMYPDWDGRGGGDDVSTSICLYNRSDGRVKVRYEFILRGPNDRTMHHHYGERAGSMFRPEGELGNMWRAPRFAKRSKVMRSLIEGAMVVDVKIMRADTMSKSPYIPENPALKNSVKLFMDQETADVIFMVGVQSKKTKGKRKRGEESTDFHAHRLVLKHNAPMLAEFCGPGEGEGEGELPSAVPIEDLDADIFRHLLFYVYGGEIEEEDLKKKAKEIIDAANKYGIAGLKLLAEARYVQSTDISTENMMEHLLFADAKNCALMKEAVMDFVVANDAEVLQKVSFRDCPGDLMKDLLAAMAQSKRSGKSDNGTAEDRFVMMRVDDLRRELHEKGLDVDGSREAMIVALRESS